MRACETDWFARLGCSQDEFQQERQRLIEEIALLAQDAAMNFGTLNDNLDRLLSMVRRWAEAVRAARLLSPLRPLADSHDCHEQAYVGRHFAVNV